MKPKRTKSRELAGPGNGSAKPGGGPGRVGAATSQARPRWFRLIAVLSPILLLAFLEIGLRLAGWGYPNSFFLRTRENGRSLLIDNARFGWRFFPRSVARTPRPCSLDAKKPPGTVRVFVLGESAAMGDPEPTYGFPRQLERILQARHLDQRVEVINAAMTAINSHVMREIARDCRVGEGDFWVIYAGNNEVVGPFGAGTVFGRQAPGLAAVRLNLALKTTRIGQLVSGWVPQRAEPSEWAGMELFLDQQVRRDDPRLQTVYTNFAANLAAAIQFGLRSGAAVLLATVPVNLRDCPPFGSLHREGLSADEKAAWEKSYTLGAQAEADGRFAKAIAAYEQAAAIDKAHAELLFRLGTCKLQQGRTADADADFRLARDLDTLRFRADSRLGQIIRQAAAAQGVPLVDAEAECARRSLNGVPGEDFFFDHVHLNFYGNYWLATLVATQLEKIWPNARAGSPTAEIPEAEVARRLAFTDFDRRRIAEEMRARLQQPPFSSQINFQRRDEHWQRVLATLQAPPRDSVPAYEAALTLSTNDWMLHANFARLFEADADAPRATAQWREVTRLMPHAHTAWLNLGNLAHSAGRYAEAERFFLEALQRNPDCLEALNELGLVAAAQGQAGAAQRYFKHALRLKPAFNAARVNLALVLADGGDTNGAATQYREVLRRDANNVDARVNLGVLLARQGRPDDALTLYSEALRLKPDSPPAHFNLASLLTAQGRLAEAVPHFEAVVRARPELAQAQLEFGLVLGRLGRDTEALPRFAEAARLKPDMVDARFNHGVALAKARRYLQAREEFQATLRLQPTHPHAAKALEQATRAAAQDTRR